MTTKVSGWSAASNINAAVRDFIQGDITVNIFAPITQDVTPTWQNPVNASYADSRFYQIGAFTYDASKGYYVGTVTLISRYESQDGCIHGLYTEVWTIDVWQASVDADVDSNNDSGFAPDPHTPGDAEDKIEDDSALPGKIVDVNDALSSKDVPGWADGFNQDGQTDPPDDLLDDQDPTAEFVPIVITVGPGFDPKTASLKIEYSDSDPSQVTRKGSGTDDDPYVYTLPSDGGALRLWTTQGNVERNAASFTTETLGTTEGYYVPAGTYSGADLAKLGFTNGNLSITLYIERVQTTQSKDQRQITVSLKPDANTGFIASDQVLVGDGVGLTIDSLNVSSGPPDDTGALAKAQENIQDDPTKTGKIVAVDSILNTDGVPEFAAGLGSAPWPGNSSDNSDFASFVPVIITLPQGIDPSVAQLIFAYAGSDPHLVSGPGNNPNGGYSLPATGTLRLWDKDSSQQRKDSGIADGGDYITPGKQFDASKLTWTTESDGSHQATIYLEAVKASLKPGDQQIQVKVDPDGVSGNAGFILSDAVRATAVAATVMDYSSDAQLPGGVAANDDGGDPGSLAYSGAVRMSDGTVHYSVSDISSDDFNLPWGQTRTYTTDPLGNLNPTAGNGWDVTQWPQLVQGTGTIIAEIGGNELFFDDNGDGTYTPRFFSQEQLTSSGNTFTLTDTLGDQYVFNDFSVSNDSDPTKGIYTRGGLVSYTDADGIKATVASTDDLGNIKEIDVSNNDKYIYTYKTASNGKSETLSNVQLQRGGTVVQEVDYTYYADTNGKPGMYGGDGDLESATVKELSNGTLATVGGSYYRYQTAANSPSLLTTAVEGENFLLLLSQNGNSVSSLKSVANSVVAPYATYQFTYSGAQVASQTIQGAGIAGGTTAGVAKRAGNLQVFLLHQHHQWHGHEYLDK